MNLLGEDYDRLDVKHNGDGPIREAQDTVARLGRKVEITTHHCLCLLSCDDAPREVPDPKPDEHVSQKTKILIYQEFPSFSPLARNVSTL